MPFNLPLITMVPQTLARSTDVNADFVALNTRGMQSLSSDAGALSSNGHGGLLFGGLLGVNTPGDVLDVRDPANTYLKSRSAGGAIVLQIPAGTSQVQIDSSGVTMFTPNTVMNFFDGSIGRVGRFSGVGSGTYNHSLSIAPLWVCPIVTVDGSATRGYDSVGATTIHVTMGDNALAFLAWCFR